MNCLYVLYINPLYINPMLLLLLCHVSSVQLLSLANISFIPYAVFLLTVSFAVQKLLGLIRFNLFIFTFTSFVIRKQIKKKKRQFMSKCSSFVSFLEFVVLSPTFIL